MSHSSKVRTIFLYTLTNKKNLRPPIAGNLHPPILKYSQESRSVQVHLELELERKHTTGEYTVTLLVIEEDGELPMNFSQFENITRFIFSVHDTKSNDEWITKEGDVIFDEDNVQVEQPLGESGSGSNSDLVGGSSSDPTLDAFDIDKLILNDNVEDHFSNKEEFEDDEDEDDGGGVILELI
ncbi:hypothetical protein HKD37_04G009425 [Glycine soja]